jgi:hypothetical protein
MKRIWPIATGILLGIAAWPAHAACIYTAGYTSCAGNGNETAVTNLPGLVISKNYDSRTGQNSMQSSLTLGGSTIPYTQGYTMPGYTGTTVYPNVGYPGVYSLGSQPFYTSSYTCNNTGCTEH